ncbi:hypothetical protein NF867_14420 [Solitalea sp. MAHUQ-68]|uniref:Uncharacterized protein n=1 Tax=Solitalea agri TaxID=2953739 RepID=A0A9X2FBY2_9SPHI|nr:hypothetical protein [Solitalea agri]MCO4294058.1 hypothetical protein [Solitalea agri]
MIPILGIAQISFAQKNKGKNKEVPVWVRMMDEPGVNYNQAIAEFEKFWAGRQRPEVENELFESAGNEERERELERKQKRLSKNDPAVIYASEYKQFIQWQIDMAGLVKPDGTVMTMEERLGEWKKDQEFRKAYQYKPHRKDKEPGKDRPVDPQKKEKEVGKDNPADPEKKEKEVPKDQQPAPIKPIKGKN